MQRFAVNVFGVLLIALFIVACDQPRAPKWQPAEQLPGGEGSVSVKPFPSFVLPAANLPAALKPDFHAGKALAHQPWVKAPTITTARDGLGPVYNARTCLACHVNGGRGQMPEDSNRGLRQAFLRLSIPGTDEVLGVIPEPVYGDQLQTQSVALYHQLGKDPQALGEKAAAEVAPEAYVYVDWQTHTFNYPDGDSIELRKPAIRIEQLGFGELHPEVQISLRNAPPLIGVGLLELIPESSILANADPNDMDGDGISGRINRVWNFVEQKPTAGRFGWKANRADLIHVTASAFANDIGITNSIFNKEPCTQQQITCLQTKSGADANGVELSDELLILATNFTRNIGVPRRAPLTQQAHIGRELFYKVGCVNCHKPGFVTAASREFPHLGEKTIWPYTDLLLHDLGEALADGRSDYLASGTEWRTPPLWGVGLSEKVNGSQLLLHDGRARTVEEAIIWHGGEADSAKQEFIQLTKNQRQALIAFVRSL